jgi:hypothetical protein
VLDISIEATMVVNIRPRSRFLGFLPLIFRVSLNRAWSSFVFVMAAARKNPPSRSQMTLLEKVWTYFSIFSGAELKYLFPSAKTRKAMMKRLTANAGMASVIHSPMEKNRRKMTYTWESVKPGSFRRKVNPIARAREIKNERIDFFCCLVKVFMLILS